MLDVLQEPPPPFADIIRTHFRLKAKPLAVQLDKWLREDDGTATNRNNPGGVVGGAAAATAASVAGASRNNSLKKHVDDLKVILAQLTVNGEAAARQAKASAMETD